MDGHPTELYRETAAATAEPAGGARDGRFYSGAFELDGRKLDWIRSSLLLDSIAAVYIHYKLRAVNNHFVTFVCCVRVRHT